jgi:hypothetical protein
MFAKFMEKYPHSFNGDELDMDRTSDRDTYAAAFAARNHFQTADQIEARFHLTQNEKEELAQGELVVRRNTIDLVGLNEQEKNILQKRPKGAPLPSRLAAYGSYNFLFLLDFGSFRDIQRHRNGVCQIPVVDGRYGIHPWYLHELEATLSSDDFAKLQHDIAAQFEAIKALPQANDLDSQYYYPMGTMALVQVSYSVPQTQYVGELRSGKTVHGSLRPIAQKMLQVLETDLPDIALYGDMDAENFTAKRGEQTIMAKAG